MPRRSKVETDYHHSRFTQISESHCGPAVIQMMLAYLAIEVSQEQVTEAAGVQDRIEDHGTRVDQLAKAVQTISPDVTFYYKEHSKLAELVKIVTEYEYPVGVEWQGLFEGDPDTEEAQAAGALLPPDSESEDSDYGHYSLVIGADTERRLLMIADPYKDFISQDRIFTFRQFDSRWFDYNEVTNPKTGRAVIKKDNHMMFIVVPTDETFPVEMGMKKFEGSVTQGSVTQ